MSIGYENRRDQFDKIVKKYKEYISLYKFINNGSLEGLTTFDIFYWEQSYYSQHRFKNR